MILADRRPSLKLAFRSPSGNLMLHRENPGTEPSRGERDQVLTRELPTAVPHKHSFPGEGISFGLRQE